MAKFRHKKTNEIREAFSIEKIGKKVHIQFTKDGKKYIYDERNIEIIEDEKENDGCLDSGKSQSNKEKIRVYSITRTCYSCQNKTEILTYIKFDDGTNEDLIYPWDKRRLHRNISSEAVMNHMMNPDIEFYPIKIIGSDDMLDEIMLNVFPERIKMKYSSTQRRYYPMNICQHCRAKQGEFFIYEQLNTIIRKMENISIPHVILKSKL